MRLKQLELNGYKSFARSTRLEFTAPVTAVVGPNGSGKSNIVEAFRFVLGEQSMKAMRGQKGEDMIFNGSHEVSRANRAAVRLTLDNSDRLLNVDFDTVTIERIVYRDGTNEYLLNGGKVRLKDILELLSAAHIGVSSHHIISQGQADRILNAKPLERKEMIEDALGLKIYQYKRKESERKLEKTEENLREVELLRRELAPRIQFLKRQVEKIERAHELKRELTQAYLEYFKREQIYLEQNRIQLENEKQAPVAELADIKTKVEELRQHLNQQDDQSGADQLQELTAELNRVRNHRDQTGRRLGQIEGQLESVQHQLEKDRVSAQEVKIPYPAAQALEQEIGGLVDQATDQIHQTETVQGLLQEIKTKLKHWLSQFEHGTGQQTQDLETKRQVLEQEKQAQEHRIEELKQEEQALLDQYAQTQKDQTNSQDQNREVEREMYRLLNRQKDLESIIARIDSQEEARQREAAGLKRDLTEAGTLIGQAVTRYPETDLQTEDGRILTEAEIFNEPRSEQERRRNEIERQKIRLDELGLGQSSEEVMKEYQEVKERDEFLARELEDLKHSVQSLQQMIQDLNQTLEQEFRTGLEKIDRQFKEFFTSVFGGGRATVKRVLLKPKNQGLEETESEPEEIKPREGVEIDLSLPQKKIRGLMMLSGGERALTSVALTFAITQVNPPPFLVLDETDAALDEANSERYAKMLKTLSEHSQLIIITHNRETMAQADVLYGVTMGHTGSSQLLSIKFEEVEEMAK